MTKNLIDRKQLMVEFATFVRRPNNHDHAPAPTWNDAVSLVGSMPAHTECEDCQYSFKVSKAIRVCAKMNMIAVADDFYCGFAKEREE